MSPGVAGDLCGNMRIWNDRVNMGCYEFGAFGFGDLNCDGAFNGGDNRPVIHLPRPWKLPLTLDRVDAVERVDSDPATPRPGGIPPPNRYHAFGRRLISRFRSRH